MDQGHGHGHYGWNPLTQEEFYELHSALEIVGAFEVDKSEIKRETK